LTGRFASPTFGTTRRRIRVPEGNGRLRDAIVSALRCAATSVPKEVEHALRQARDREEGTAREELGAILENLEVARRQGVPL
jgi:tartrate dehydratase alpha subunit/fumarate hydratase class I-like protein